MIRSAKKNEAKVLTKISFASKGHWAYPQEYFEIWKNELTISPEYIEKHDVVVYEIDSDVIGYYSIVELTENKDVSGIKICKGFWLEHMFVEPKYIGKGIGTEMFNHIRKTCRERKITELGVLADPNSKGFYEKMGCKYIMEYPSTINNRTTPYLLFQDKDLSFENESIEFYLNDPKDTNKESLKTMVLIPVVNE